MQPSRERATNRAARRSTGHRARHAAGISVLELLIVLAVLAIVAGIAIPNGRRILQGQEHRAAVTSIQQTVWQGATAAAARGNEVYLERSGDVFTLTEAGTGKVLKTFDLPDGVSTNWPEDVKLTFTPPGKVASLAVLPKDLSVVADGKTTNLTLSLIGEVKAEAAP